jgi:hypothetical protein
MKYEIAMKWVEALRSGNYKQGQYYIKNNDKFCCLGVLCDISKQGEWKEGHYLNNDEYLPEEVMEWAGMKSSSGCFNVKSGRNLSKLNDNGMTFEEIADIIEKHWETL